MGFDPKTKKYPYPKDTSEHYLKIKKNRNIKFDSNYPFVNTKKSFRFLRFLVRIVLVIIVFPYSRLYLGLKIKGKKNLKENKALIKQGVISVSNHIHMWDYISIMKAIKPIKPYTIVWDKNVNGESGNLVRLVGGIPIPNNVGGKIKFFKTINELLNTGHWIHIYAEGSMWEYYYPIRPFKDGAAALAIKMNKPIIPMAFSYREPGWIRRKIFKQPAALTLNIGKPIFKNNELEYTLQKDDLTKRVHDEVCILAGINPEENIYSPYYNNSERIDYYELEEYNINGEKNE